MADVELVPVDCCSCHVIFWISKQHNARLVATKASFYCPSGHSMSYIGETDAQKLQKAQQTIQERDAEISRIQHARHEEQQKCNQEKKGLKRQINGYKGQLKMRENHGNQTDTGGK